MDKKIGFRLIPLFLSGAILAGCATNSNGDTANASTADSQNAGAVTSSMIKYDEDDYYSDWENANPVYIKLNGTTATVSGSGAAVSGSTVTISAAGVYAISGSLTNGQVVVDSKDEGTVRLVLNGAEITCSNNAPIYIKNAGKTVISLPAGTSNQVTDGKEYVFADAETDEPSAAIFSKDDLTINGTGSLKVNANYNDGITSKDDLKIMAGSIQIKSADDGVVGKDVVAVKEGTINIEAGGDGIKSTNDTDSEKGFIALQGGNYTLTTGADGIQAETSMLISGGEYNITTNGGSANGTKKSNDNGQFNPMDRQGANTNGNANNNASGATTTTTESDTESQSAKALKVSADLTITGGTFNIDSADDAIHSNNSVTIENGEFTLKTGDDGIHADSALTVKGGKIDLEKSYEGLESTVITIDGGTIHITASDDGINGSDGSSSDANGPQGQFSASEDVKVVINGGEITVNASGDGLDSNGSITMTGGTVIVNGPTDNGNGPLDYNGTFEMSGGFLIAAGSSGMAQAPSTESAQYSIAMTYSQAQKAGTLVHLEDSAGNTILTFAPEKQYQSVVISSPLLKNGGTYTLYSGGTSTGTKAEGGQYSDGTYQNGTKVVSFTLSSSVTWLNESGVTTENTGNPGGGGQGQRPQGGQGQQGQWPQGGQESNK